MGPYAVNATIFRTMKPDSGEQQEVSRRSASFALQVSRVGRDRRLRLPWLSGGRAMSKHELDRARSWNC